jgi:hypothetical protein
MTSRERLMVSYPRSGFGIYISTAMAKHLGGIDASVGVKTLELENGRLRFIVYPMEDSKLFVRAHGRSKHTARVFFNKKVPAPVEYNFGPVHLNCEFLEEGIQFVLPPRSVLTDPHTKTSHIPKQPSLDLQPRKPPPAPAATDPVEELANAFSTIGRIIKELPGIADLMKSVLESRKGNP